jgi:hypothetical protein
MVDVQAAWRAKGWGVDVGAGRKSALCNLRFADDVLLLATSKAQLRQMLEDVIKATATVGLELHFGKTVILNNIPDGLRRGATSICAGNERVEILPYEEATKYLGRKLTFGSTFHDLEIDHRIACGWAKFHGHQKELCGTILSKIA